MLCCSSVAKIVRHQLNSQFSSVRTSHLIITLVVVVVVFRLLVIFTNQLPEGWCFSNTFSFISKLWKTVSLRNIEWVRYVCCEFYLVRVCDLVNSWFSIFHDKKNARIRMWRRSPYVPYVLCRGAKSTIVNC